jgi:dolichol kinase
MGGLVSEGLVHREDVGRLVLPAYIAGGVLMVAASVFNPISSKLILLSGVAASFGSSCGLINIAGMVAGRATESDPPAQTLSSSRAWIIAAVPVAAVFVGIIGPGIPLP